ncbi:hypothetical protein AB733_24415 [Photobacterium swingsii]|uniref:Uncharacterized protein n=2 Tax=Photobacterium swingsii TaxID=680026 RepID=A0A0J8V540_9GAMM|nr:YiiX/YebB-like N1pC/P60 family cysteine hydrolase [Photobacterium swingsii]KMV28322.1 hypothetical protein AB733_24415 [Photobacterium swingsii]PSW18283.1 hypothetical protein C9I94_24590 [Photobacterium swingsii]
MVKLTEVDKNGNEHRVTGLKLFGSDYPQIITCDKIKPGDVLFCYQDPKSESFFNKKKTKLIQSKTKGIYVHCGIYLGNDLVADAAGKFVRTIKLNEFIDSYSYIVVSRCEYVKEDKITKMIAYAYNCVENKIEYDLGGAINLPKKRMEHRRFIWGNKPKPNIEKKNDKMFCSEFVLNCFKASGYISKDDKTYVAHMWSPTDLAHDDLLSFQGYIAINGIESIHRDDIFLL